MVKITERSKQFLYLYSTFDIFVSVQVAVFFILQRKLSNLGERTTVDLKKKSFGAGNCSIHSGKMSFVVRCVQ
jgi:hypothetical protein